MGLLVPFYAGNFADKNLPGGDSAKVGLIASVVSFVVTWAVRCVAACLAGPALLGGQAGSLDVSCIVTSGAVGIYVQLGVRCHRLWLRRRSSIFSSSRVVVSGHACRRTHQIADLRTFSCHCKLPRALFRLCMTQEVFSLPSKCRAMNSQVSAKIQMTLFP